MAKDNSLNRNGTSLLGFTLVELLVVVAIIGTLLMILVPGIGRALQRARETQCRAGMRAWAAALWEYSADRQGVFPHSGLQGANPPLTQQRLHSAEPWYNELPKLMRTQSLSALDTARTPPAPGRDFGSHFTCPSARAEDMLQSFGNTDFVLSYGYNMWNDLPSNVRASLRGGRSGLPARLNMDLVRAPAQHVVFGEMARVRADTMAARDLVFRHNSGQATNIAFADGHVESFLDVHVQVPESAALTTNRTVMWDPESPIDMQ